jgi:hypothetical protein
MLGACRGSQYRTVLHGPIDSIWKLIGVESVIIIIGILYHIGVSDCEREIIWLRCVNVKNNESEVADGDGRDVGSDPLSHRIFLDCFPR